LQCHWTLLAGTFSAQNISNLLHGLVNEFLHDTRVAALVWGQMALLAGGKTGFPDSTDVNN